jgi:polyisoprenoid-binding protein YceI
MIRTGQLRPALLGIAFSAICSTAIAAPKTYQIDSAHTYPSFEVDHSGGTSVWRGKFNTTTGSITMDKEAQTGTVTVSIDINSIDFGHDGLNDHTKTNQAGMLDAAQFPTATYQGTLAGWRDGAPTTVEGSLTLHGVTVPVNLEIRSFKCAPGRQGGEVCGADAHGEFDRAAFGVNFGSNFGFDMGVALHIQIEAATP